MYLDASANIAILTDEEDAVALIDRIEAANTTIHCSPITIFEATIGLARKSTNKQLGVNKPVPAEEVDKAKRDVEDFLNASDVVEVVITTDINQAAIDAAKTFGKFVAHPARLNMGDCFAYACAKKYDLPLLYKGNDFSRTDIDGT